MHTNLTLQGCFNEDEGKGAKAKEKLMSSPTGVEPWISCIPSDDPLRPYSPVLVRTVYWAQYIRLVDYVIRNDLRMRREIGLLIEFCFRVIRVHRLYRQLAINLEHLCVW